MEREEHKSAPPAPESAWRIWLWVCLPGCCASLGFFGGIFLAWWCVLKLEQWYPPADGGYFTDIGMAILVLTGWSLLGGIVCAIPGWYTGRTLARRIRGRD